MTAAAGRSKMFERLRRKLTTTARGPPVVIGICFILFIRPSESLFVVGVEAIVGDVAGRADGVNRHVLILVLFVVIKINIVFIQLFFLVHYLFFHLRAKLSKIIFNTECVVDGQAALVARCFLCPIINFFFGACEFMESRRFIAIDLRVFTSLSRPAH